MFVYASCIFMPIYIINNALIRLPQLTLYGKARSSLDISLKLLLFQVSSEYYSSFARQFGKGIPYGMQESLL